MSMFTRLTRVVTYCEDFPPMFLPDHSMMCSCKVTWQMKYIIFPLAGDLWTPNRQGLSCCDRFLALKPHDPLIT